ncbi:MAG: alpha/beta hydrolase [Vicinamibacterales bacterium]
MTATDPHRGQPIEAAGPAPPDARLTVILIHGRGGSADDMLGLADELGLDDVAFLAPQAAARSWYPYSFLSPITRNEPGITSGLAVLAHLIAGLESQGIPAARIALLGFSQGACLSLEFAARTPRRYAAIVGLSGGLIGPAGTPRNYPGSMQETPVFLGCSDVDSHIPVDRVSESAAVFRALGAEVDERIYRGMGHTVNADEIAAVRGLLGGCGAQP